MASIQTLSPSTDPAAWHLAENAAVRISRHHGAVVVRVERGTVLVTQEDDVEDHVLERGDELVLARRGLAVAWAFTDATITVREAGPADTAPASGARGLTSRDSSRARPGGRPASRSLLLP